MPEQTTETASKDSPPPARPDRSRRSWPRRYLRSIVIGAILAFSVELPIHAWKSSCPPEERHERTVDLTRLNQAVLDAPKSVRPWDAGGSFYHRITSSTYCITELHLPELFRWDDTKPDLKALGREIEEKGIADADWNKMRPHRPAMSASGASVPGFLLGIPDGLIFTIRRICSGGWLNVVFNIIALLCAILVALRLRTGRRRRRNIWLIAISLPLLTSLCGTVLWVVMWLATLAFAWLSLPAASIWAFLLPGLIGAGIHVPLVTGHQLIEDATAPKEEKARAA
jgi:hypothetical protein